MTSRPLLAALTTLLLASVAAAGEPPRLDMVFYQPDLEQGLDSPVRRRADLDRAAAAGVRELIVQYLGIDRWDLLQPWPGDRDPIAELLDEAAHRGMRVWLGTWEDPRLWKRKTVPLWLWRQTAERGLEVARRAADRYGDHPAFAGWYWTPEVVWWRPPGPRRLEQLALVTWEAIQGLRALEPSKPVAVVLGPGGRGEGNLLGISWCRYVEASRPDVVVVMDGVGSAHLDVLLAPALYDLVGLCADRVGAEVWADVELFGPDLEMRPTRSRLERQYAAARGGADMVGAFDLPHYLAASTAGEAWLRGEEPGGRELEVSGWSDEPSRDWLARPIAREGSVTVDLAGGPIEAIRVEVLTRGVHPRTMTLTAFGRAATWEEWGELEPRHGPGRDERTWVWEGTGRREATRIRVFARAGRNGMRLVDVQVFGRTDTR